MKNSRIILLYRIIVIFLFITVGITYYRIKKDSLLEYKDDGIIVGIINDIKEVDSGIQIELVGKEKVLVIYNDKIDYKLGDKIKAYGEFEVPSKNTIFNLFNYRNYLKSREIKYIFKASKVELISANKLLKYKIKNSLIKRINKYRTSDYLMTFILGSNNIEKTVKKSYQVNGISHLFAVSGMHLSFFSFVLLFILKRIGFKENACYIIIILFFLFFSFLTNYSPSVLRALILYILVVINKVFRLNFKTIYLLIIDLIVLLIYNPFYVYSSGFLYSFTISFFLILFSNFINKCERYFFKIFLTSVISFLSSIPISINSFNEINLLTPFINLLFVPFISFVIFPMSILVLIVRSLDNIFLILINILEQVSLMISKVKVSIILSHIPWYILIVYYIVLILFIDGLFHRKLMKTQFLILLMFIHINMKSIYRVDEVTFLDVGQGDSSLFEISNKNILIDTGGNNNASIVENKTIPYLKSRGIMSLDYLILTHGDFDHMGEAINLVNNFKVDKVIFNCGSYNDLEKELIKVLDKKKIKYYSCIKELNIGNNKLYFLQTKGYDNENDNSNVIYTELYGYKFMFMGDASSTTEHAILDKYNLSDIDVLKVGHHGSKSSSSKEFINDINPKYSIISVGKNNRYGHPNKEALDNLKNSKIYRTDEDGSIMFKIKNNKLKIETCSP